MGRANLPQEYYRRTKSKQSDKGDFRVMDDQRRLTQAVYDRIRRRLEDQTTQMRARFVRALADLFGVELRGMGEPVPRGKWSLVPRRPIEFEPMRTMADGEGTRLHRDIFVWCVNLLIGSRRLKSNYIAPKENLTPESRCRIIRSLGEWYEVRSCTVSAFEVERVGMLFNTMRTRYFDGPTQGYEEPVAIPPPQPMMDEAHVEDVEQGGNDLMSVEELEELAETIAVAEAKKNAAKPLAKEPAPDSTPESLPELPPFDPLTAYRLEDEPSEPEEPDEDDIFETIFREVPKREHQDGDVQQL